jgi:hypothetical protein
MTTKMNMTRDINGFVDFILPISDTKYSVNLATAVDQSVTVPSDAKVFNAIFGIEPGTVVWVSVNEPASLPTGTFAISRSAMNPAGLRVNAGDVIHFVTDDTTAEVGVQFYAIQ